MHLPRRFRGRKLWSEGPVWAKPEQPAPKPELPVWASREFTRSLSHVVIMGLGFLAFVAVVVWFITHPVRASQAAPAPRQHLAPEQAIEVLEPDTSDVPSR